MALVFPYPQGKNDGELYPIFENLLVKRISLDSNIVEPKPLISLGNAPILYRGSLCFISGPAGSRKTSGLVLLCSDLICHNNIKDSPFAIPNSLTVLFIDTEQIKFDTHNIVKRVSHYVGYDLTQRNLFVYSFLEYDIELNPCLLEFLIAHHRPDVVIIDNVSHMGEGIIMELKAAELLLRNLRQIAQNYNIAIIGVLHTNEGTVINSPRGHGGSEAVREADLVLMFSDVPNENYSKVFPIKARREKPGLWGVAIDEKGIPYYHKIENNPQKSSDRIDSSKINKDQYKKYLREIPKEGMTSKELTSMNDQIDKYNPVGSKKTSSNAYNRLKKLKELKLIVQINGRYYFNDNQITREDKENDFI